MRIYIITMDDPVYTYDFIKEIIDARGNDIVGLAVPKGDRLTLSKGKSIYIYMVSLFLIMGPCHFVKNAFIAITHKIKKKLYSFGLIKDPTILGYTLSKGIEAKKIKSPNNKKFLEYLKTLDIDIIINQSQNILKKDLLDIPKIGVLNRHNALLPKNRGRLTPFWVLYKGENETGVSIHFVEESLDSGDIIIQKRYCINRKDTFNTIVAKNYSLASLAMLEALEVLEEKNNNFIANSDKEATYNTTPTLKEAFNYCLGKKIYS